MKRLALVSIAALSVSACHRMEQTAPAESYQHWTDQMIVRLGLQKFDMWPCIHKTIVGGRKQYDQSPTDKCYKMQPQQRWRGIYVLGPYQEGEQFCPDATEPCRWEKEPRYELDWGSHALKGQPQMKLEWGRSYAIEFDGRRTVYQLNDLGRVYNIAVDRLISATDVGPSPM